MEFLAFEDGVIRDPRYRDELSPIANRLEKKAKFRGEPHVTKSKFVVRYRKKELSKCKQPFACNPHEIVFRDFDVGASYTTTVKLLNVSSEFNSFRISPVSPEYSDIISVEYELPSRIAAGLSWCIKINFNPSNNEDITTKLQITTENGYFFLPIRTLKKRAVVTVDCTDVDFGTLTLGESKKKIITLSNNGASVGPVYISGSFKKVAEKTHIDPVSKQEYPYLVINPLMFRIDIPAFSKFQVELIFAPYEEVDFNCTIIFSDRNENTTGDFSVNVRGKASSLPVHVSSPGIDFSWCFYGCTYSGEVSITNKANITAIVEPEVPKELQSVIRFDPKMVCIQAGTELSIKMYFTPKPFLGCDFSAVIDFNVKGQTLPATVGITALLTTREPRVTTPVIDLGTSFINNEVVGTVSVLNQSDLPQMIGFPRLPENISAYPQALTILPKEEFVFNVNVVPPCVGKYSQQLYLLNEYGDKRSVEINGIGTLPLLKFSETTFFLPPCPIDSSLSVNTVVKNTAKEYCHFKFQVPGEYIQISPSSGAIRPGESIPIVIFFIPPPEFVSIAAEVTSPSLPKQLKRKKMTKAHTVSRESPQTLEVEIPKISSYVDWEDSGDSYWSKHKRVLIKCISTVASEETEEVCFLKVSCTAIKASVVGRSLISIKTPVKDGEIEKKPSKNVKKVDPKPILPNTLEMISVSPFKSTLFIDFGEVTLNRITQKICFLKSNEVEPQYFQLRPVDLVSPFTVIRYPDSALKTGEEDVVIIQFQPSEYGVYSDVITFSTTSANDIDIFLTGACCCTDLVVSLERNMDVTSPSDSVVAIPIATTLVTGTTSVPIYFFNRGAFALDVFIQAGEDLDWEQKRTFVIHPNKFIVPPKGSASSNCLFSPPQEGLFSQALVVHAGGFEHKLQVEGRGTAKPVYFVPPSQESAIEEIAISHADPFYGRSSDYPFHLHFTKGETKYFVFGCIKGGPVAECTVEKWSDVYTTAGWSVDSHKLSLVSESQVSLGIQLSYTNIDFSGEIPFCRFCIYIRCPSDPSNDEILYICCTGI